MYPAQYLASGVLLILLVATGACDTKNKNKVECRAADCSAVCLDLGYQDGECDEEDVCVCDASDSGPYWWGDGGPDDASTDSDTTSDPDSGSKAREPAPRAP